MPTYYCWYLRLVQNELKVNHVVHPFCKQTHPSAIRLCHKTDPGRPLRESRDKTSSIAGMCEFPSCRRSPQPYWECLHEEIIYYSHDLLERWSNNTGRMWGVSGRVRYGYLCRCGDGMKRPGTVCVGVVSQSSLSASILLKVLLICFVGRKAGFLANGHW